MPEHNVYLATDNAVTQRRFLEHSSFGARVHTCARIEADATRLRQTDLADAAVDILTCAAASGPFKGTYTSSFSDAILRLRTLAGSARDDDEHAQP